MVFQCTAEQIQQYQKTIIIIIIIMNHNKQFYTRVYCLYIRDYAVKRVFTAFLYFTSILHINTNS